MNNEIKEILDKIQNVVEHKEASYNGLIETKAEDYKLLLDYITNLQQEIEKLNDDKRGMLVQLYKANDEKDKIKQENERLKELVDADNESYDIQETIINRQKSELLEQEDYKSRCEKANNQLKIIMQIIKERPTRNIEDDEWLENRLIGVVNILQNGSEEK